jgi:hydroxysqualene dehydroxylase
MAATVHVIGAGLAGLAAAVRLASNAIDVVVHEAAGQAGGRCRSYHDPALDLMIDNGNHLVLSGNHSTLAYVALIGAAGKLVGPPHADFAFVDLASGERWTLSMNEGRLPWWIFRASRRVPGTSASDYLSLARLLRPGNRKTICETVKCSGLLYHRLLRPFWLAALNTEPSEASAQLAAAVTRETLAKGGRACRPLIARDGLAQAFVAPALAFLHAHNAKVRFGNRLRAIEFTGNAAAALDFGDEKIPLGDGDTAILALPPMVAGELVPDIKTPSEFRAIVNAHYRIAPPEGLPPMIGVVNGTIEWLFRFKDRLAVTISAADRLLDTPRDVLAEEIWEEVATVARLRKAMPPWQIVRERRATFAATPTQNAKRPAARTAWRNLFLAGDWTDTGLPATIEGAVRSGNRAADLACAK